MLTLTISRCSQSRNQICNTAFYQMSQDLFYLNIIATKSVQHPLPSLALGYDLDFFFVYARMRDCVFVRSQKRKKYRRKSEPISCHTSVSGKLLRINIHFCLCDCVFVGPGWHRTHYHETRVHKIKQNPITIAK